MVYKNGKPRPEHGVIKLSRGRQSKLRTALKKPEEVCDCNVLSLHKRLG